MIWPPGTLLRYIGPDKSHKMISPGDLVTVTGKWHCSALYKGLRACQPEVLIEDGCFEGEYVGALLISGEWEEVD